MSFIYIYMYTYIYMSGYSMWAQSKIKIVNNSLLNKQLAIFYQQFITEYIYIYIYIYITA